MYLNREAFNQLQPIKHVLRQMIHNDPDLGSGSYPGPALTRVTFGSLICFY